MTTRVSILGAGSWGTALAVLLCGNGHRVSLWTRDPEQAAALSETRENTAFLPGVFLDASIEVCSDLRTAMTDADFLVFAVPSQAVREVARQAAPFFHKPMLPINAAKGFENGTRKRLSQVLREELGTEELVVLSGPSHAEEVGRGMDTSVAAASEDEEAARRVQDLFMNPQFRVYCNSDLIGVEVAGATKNIIAICYGVLDGVGAGDNLHAALFARGLAEITRLGSAMGADPQTFYGLAGIGDLMVTCTSVHSRNHRAGIRLGQGVPLERVLREMNMVVEGVDTARNTLALSRQYGVQMPITEQLCLLFDGRVKPELALRELMMRDRTREYNGR